MNKPIGVERAVDVTFPMTRSLEGRDSRIDTSESFRTGTDQGTEDDTNHEILTQSHCKVLAYLN